jgi:hypothetical protein
MDPQQEKRAVGGVVFFLLRQAVRYFTFVINVPFIFSVAAMIACGLIVLQDVYGLAPVKATAGVPVESWHFDGHDLLAAYALIALVFFLISAVVRIVFRLPRPSFKRRVITTVILASLGWAFVFAHVPYLRVAPGTSRGALAGIFAVFYVIGIIGFVAGAAINHFSDLVLERWKNAVESVGAREHVVAPLQ